MSGIKGIKPKNFEDFQKIGWVKNKGSKKSPLSQETKDKISKAHQGIKASNETRNKLSDARKRFYQSGGSHPKGMLGKKATEVTRKKMSISKKGEKSYLWKGGITPQNEKIRKSIEMRLWRESVFARDKFTCQICEKKGGELNADHIKPFALFPELRFVIGNGRTLCVECHLLVTKQQHKHKIFTSSVNTRFKSVPLSA